MDPQHFKAWTAALWTEFSLVDSRSKGRIRLPETAPHPLARRER